MHDLGVGLLTRVAQSKVQIDFVVGKQSEAGPVVDPISGFVLEGHSDPSSFERSEGSLGGNGTLGLKAP